jgi:hypothetical protein
VDEPTRARVTAYLAGVRQRSECPVPHVTSLPISHDGVRSLMESAGDVPRLLTAVEAVLAQHQPGRIVILGALCPRHENHRHFSITSLEAADVVACEECAATVYDSCAGCGPQISLDLCPTRAVIATAVLEACGG